MNVIHAKRLFGIASALEDEFPTLAVQLVEAAWYLKKLNFDAVTDMKVIDLYQTDLRSELCDWFSSTYRMKNDTAVEYHIGDLDPWWDDDEAIDFEVWLKDLVGPDVKRVMVKVSY